MHNEENEIVVYLKVDNAVMVTLATLVTQVPRRLATAEVAANVLVTEGYNGPNRKLNCKRRFPFGP